MQLPVYTHPTTTVLVDDSGSFLKSLSFQLDPALATNTFHDTGAALDWFLQSPQRSEVPLRANFDAPNQAPEHCNVTLDLDRIYRICGQPRRFAIPSVLVVDYSMPQMNGIDFCKAVQHLPCKKIMFTGAGDEKVAVDAFNRGLIDRYIRKGDETALDQLEREIAALQRAFFLEQATLREVVMLHHYSFLHCPAMTHVVQEQCQRHGFVEHYIFPNPNGMLFIDKYGKAKLMVIETEQGLRSQYEIARDNDAPPTLLSALLERRLLPFFSQAGGDSMYSKAVGDNWHRYCAAPQVCHGREAYYWALFDVPPHYLGAPIYSHSLFLRERHAPANAAA